MKFKMKRLPLDDAEDQQIAEYVEAMGVEVEAGATRAGLLALLSTVHDQQWILVSDLPDDINEVMQAQIEEVMAPAQQKLEGGIGDNDPTVRIKITTTNMPGGQHPVSVGVNGRVVVIQRGKTIDLPMRYFYALEKAVAAEVTQNLTTGEITETEVQNYPVQVLGMPPLEEIRAWRARVDDDWMPA